MRSDFNIDAQISEIFRVYTRFFFEIPLFSIQLKEFFADYNIYDHVFLRAGKYDLTWGISPNYDFTNLLSRVRQGMTSGDSFIAKVDIPVGIGGFQFLILTRANLMGGVELERQYLAYGGKFNLALRMADFDLGVFYQEDQKDDAGIVYEGIDLRSFLSIKTTVFNTELYNEWLAAVDVDEPETISGAVNLGFARTFNKLTAGAELFYNAEGNALMYQRETMIKKADTLPFIKGFNMALNLLYRFGGKGNPRLFFQTLYAPEQESARLVPGIRISPFPHTELSFAVPMALGSKDGYYYQHTPDTKDRPFAIVVLFSIKGGVRSGYYY
jgi:hypothetical protein